MNMLCSQISQIHQSIKAGRLKPEDLIEEAYSRIAVYESKINSFITLRDKREVFKEIKTISNSSSPLNGIPYVLKDPYVTKNIETTSASNVLRGFIPPYSATVYSKLQAAGAVLIGKMNMDAWGHGGSTENTDYGPTHNPWNLELVAGGSSGGPAAAISAGFTTFAIGEDTGGSIRNPSAWTNTTGLKVTYGRVSRYGTIAYASGFDSVGPMGRTAEDLAYILRDIAGIDPYDATSARESVDDYPALLNQDIASIKIGIPTELYGEGLDPEIKQVIFDATKAFTKLGVELVEVKLPIAEIGLAAYYLIGPSETSSNLARYDAIRYGNSRDLLSEETKRRVMIGTYALSAGYYDAYYRKAQKVRTLLIEAYSRALEQCDVLIMPVTPTMPTKIGQLINDPLANMLADIYTTSQNPVGIPSLALPAGFSQTGLPIGMQLVGRKFSEVLLLSLGHQYQQITDWHNQKPNLPGDNND